jgi:hypothetical protein
MLSWCRRVSFRGVARHTGRGLYWLNRMLSNIVLRVVGEVDAISIIEVRVGKLRIVGAKLNVLSS